MTTTDPKPARRMTTAALVARLAEATGLDRKSVQAVLAALPELAVSELKRSGKVTLPGLVTIVAKQKPATPERQALNPFTKEPMVVAAKPASTRVSARPAKNLAAG